MRKALDISINIEEYHMMVNQYKISVKSYVIITSLKSTNTKSLNMTNLNALQLLSNSLQLFFKSGIFQL